MDYCNIHCGCRSDSMVLWIIGILGIGVGYLSPCLHIGF